MTNKKLIFKKGSRKFKKENITSQKQNTKVHPCKLERQATWEEAVSEYKGASQATKKRAKELMERFRKYYEVLKKCKRTSR